MDSETHWVEPRQLSLVPVPLSADLRSSNTTVRLFDGGFLVFGPNASVRRFDHAGKVVSPAIPLPYWPIFRPTPCPDGRWLTWKDSPDEVAPCRLWEIGATNAAVNLGDRGSAWLIPTFSNESRQLAAITPMGELLVRSLYDRRHLKGAPSTHGTPTALSFSQDDRQLVVSWQDGMVNVWSAAEWDKPPASLLTGTEAIWCVAFSPDGRRVVGGGDDGEVFLWDVSTRQLAAKFKAPGNAAVLGVGFSEDGGTLFASTPPSVCIWRTQPWK